MTDRTQTICHCGRPVESRDPDPWEGRMDAYCYDCATCRCDTSDAVCPHASSNSAAEREIVIQAIAESLYGEGCYPFNDATGFTVRHESEQAADAVLAALGRVIPNSAARADDRKTESIYHADATPNRVPRSTDGFDTGLRP